MKRAQRYRYLRGLVWGLLLWGQSLQPAWAEVFDHSQWDRLLKAYVVEINQGQSTAVNYQGMADEQIHLSQYLERLSSVTQQDFDQWSHPQQLAFLINAYNAWTVDLVLTRWPDVTSIKELGGLFTSPWRKDIVSLFGKRWSLDDIEHTLIRKGPYHEPRIHFAVNCGSISCPGLRNEAYTGARLNAQLQGQTLQFLSDTSRNRVIGDEIQLSSIFKWYRNDFEKGWNGFHHLESFLLSYADALKLSPAMRQQLKNRTVKIEYLDYDWRLNRLPADK